MVSTYCFNHLKRNKKSEMGIGTLVIFIAILLVAAVAAGVLLQTSGTLQQQALRTGQESKRQIATSAFTLSISGTDGRSTYLTDFSQIIRLNPGSESITLSDSMINIWTKSGSATLKYRGIAGLQESNNQEGYNTWWKQEFGVMEVWKNVTSDTIFAGPDAYYNFGLDLDNDGLWDSFITCDGSGLYCPTQYDGTHLRFEMTTDGPVYVELINDDGTPVDISAAGNGFDFTNVPIGDYGYITAFRTSGGFDDWILSGDTDIYFEIIKKPSKINADLDDDNLDEGIFLTETDAVIILGNGENITVSLGVNISNPNTPIYIENKPLINSDGDVVAYLDIDSPNAGNRIIPAGDKVMITPQKLGQGYFTIVYETKSKDYRPGKFSVGDVIRLYYQSPGPVGYDENMKVLFIPKSGTAVATSFTTPDVISEKRTYVFP